MNSDKTRKRLVLLMVAILLISFLVVTWKLGMPLIALAKEPQRFQAWLNAQGIFASLLMIGIIFFQIVIAFIPGEPFEIGAGFVFGFWKGTILCLIGSVIASALIMLLVRRYGKQLILVFFSQEKLDALWFLKDQRKLSFWTFVAFIIPGSPKDILTYGLGLTNMKLSTFLLISTIARIPSIITSTFSGNALKEENYQIAIIAFLFTFIISVAGLWLYSNLMKHCKSKDIQKMQTN